MIVRLRLTVLRVGFKFSLAMSRVRAPAPSRLLLALLAGYGVQAMALPTGGQVAAGNVTINAPQNGSMNIVQTTDKGIVNWQSFNVGSGEKVNFLQPSSTSSTLNRVVGNDASTIFGQINANGQVFLLNTNGVLFAPGAAVNAAGLVASTLQMQDSDYLAGRFVLSGAGSGTVDNQGVIQSGFTVLAGAQVSNTGTIVADGGTAALVAGDRVTMNLTGSDVLSVSVDAPAVAAQVRAGGIVRADGGQVLISAKSADALLSTVVNVDGVVQARSIGTRDGVIVLDGGTSGVVNVSGRLDASGLGAGQTGGTVKVLGENVGLLSGATVDVSGDAGGGVVRVGGDWHGTGPDHNASQVYLAAGANIDADAVKTGNGGDVVLWSDDRTQFYGGIQARGGALSGDGGAVETSSSTLIANGQVSLHATNGKGGSWLLDPNDLEIKDTGSNDGGWSGSTWTSSGNGTSNLNTSIINSALVDGSSIKIDTGGSGGSGLITLFGHLTATLGSSEHAALTLNARGSILLKNGSSITATGGGLDVTLNAGQNAAFDSPGTRTTTTVNMESGATIDTGTGNFVVNQQPGGTGGNGTKVSNVQLADLHVGGNATINTFGGDVTQVQAITVGGTLTANTGDGAVTLTGANHIGTLAATTSSASAGVNVVNAAALALGAINTTDLTVNTTNNALTQAPSTDLTVSGTLDVTTGTATADIGSTASSIGTFNASSSNSSADAVRLRTNAALALGSLDVVNVTVNTNNHNLTQGSGHLDVTGLLDIDVGSGTADLGDATSSVVHAFNAHSTNTGTDAVKLQTTSDIELGALNAVNVTVDTNGHAVTQAAGTHLGVTGTLAVTTNSADITLGDASSTVATFSADAGNANAVVLTTGSATALGALRASNLTVDTTGHTLSQAAGTDLHVAGTVDVTTGAATTNIGSASSTVGTFNASSSSNAVDAVKLQTGSSLVLGNIGAVNATVNSNGHDVSESGSGQLNVSGTLSISAGAGAIDVGNATNTVVGRFDAQSTNTSADAVHLQTNTAVALGNVNAVNATIETNGHDVTQAASSALNVSATLDVRAGTGSIVVGDSSSAVGAFNASSSSAVPVSITTDAALALGTIHAGSVVVATNGHDVTQAGGTALDVTDLLDITSGAGKIDVGNGASHFGRINVSSTDTASDAVRLRTNQALALGDVSAVNVTVNTNGHAVTQFAGSHLAVTGTLDVTTSSADITLGESGSTVAKFNADAGAANAVSLTTGGTTALGAIHASNLTVDTTGHALTQVAGTDLNVAGAVGVTTGAATANIGSATSTVGTFNASSTNTSVDAVKLQTGSAVVLNNVNAVNATVVTNGHDITESGGGQLNVTGTLDLSAGAGTIDVGNATNTVVGAFNAQSSNTGANAVHLQTTSALALGNVDVVNATIDTNGHAITQAGGSALAVTGTLDLTANAATIAVGNASSTVAKFNANTGGTTAVSLTTGGATALGTIHSSDLTVDTNGHALTQVAGTDLTVGGTLDVTTGAGTADIGSAASVAGTFNASSTSTAANAVQLHVNDALALGNVDVVNATIDTNGHAITQAASTALGVTGTLALTATGSTITVGNTTSTVAKFNADNGGSSAVSLTTGGATALGAIHASDLTVDTTGHALTQVAGTDLNVAGTLGVTTGAATANIGSAASTVGTFNATSSSSAVDAVKLQTGAALVLGALNAVNVTVDTNGHDVTQSGASHLDVTGMLDVSVGAATINVGDASSVVGGFGAQSTNAGAGAVQLQAASAVALGNLDVVNATINTNGHDVTQAAGTNLGVTGQLSLVPGAGAVSIGSASSTLARLDVTTTNASGVNVSTGSAIALGAIGAPSLTVDAHGHAVTQAGGTSLNVAGVASVSGSTVGIGSATSTIGTFAGTTTGAGGAAVTANDDLLLGNIGGAQLVVDTTGHNLGQAGGTNLAVTGPVTLTTGAGAIAVGSAASTVGTFNATTTNAAGATLTTGSDVALGTVHAPVLAVTTNGHNVTQAGGTDLDVAGTATIVAGTGQVTIGSAASDVGTLVASSSNAAGITVTTGANLALGAITAPKLTVATNGHDVSQSAGTDLNISGLASFAPGAGQVTVGSATSAIGAFGVTTTNAAGATVTTGSDLALAGVTAPTLTVDTNGHNLTQSAGTDLHVGIAQVSTGAGNATIGSVNSTLGTLRVGAAGAVSVTTGSALALGNITAGSLTTSAGGDVTQEGGSALTIAGATSFGAQNNPGSGTHDITIANGGNTFATFGADTTGTVRITDAADLTLGNVTAGTLVVDTHNGGHAVAQANGTATNVTGATTTISGSGNVAIGGATSSFGSFGTDASTTGAVTVTAHGPLVLNGVAAAQLTVDTTSGNGSVTQTGGTQLAVGAATVRAGTGDVTLTQAGNTLGGFAGSGHAVSVSNGAALQLGAVTATTLAVDTSSANANVTQQAGSVLAVTGATTVKSGGGSVTLDGQNQLASFGTPAAGLVTVTNAAPLVLSGISATGLVLTTNGAVTQAPATAVVVSGTTSIDATSAGNVTLANAGNDFGGSVAVSGNAISLRDANDLVLGALHSNPSTGGITLVAGGALSTQPGGIDAGAGNLTLSSGAALATSGSLAGHDVSLTGAGVVLGGDVTAAGNLTVAGGANAISQTAGNVAVTGTTTLGTTGDVLVGGAGNTFQGAVTASGANVVVDAASALTAHATATGNASFASGGALALDATSGGNLQASGASVLLGATHATGGLTATSTAGTITQNAALRVGGTTTLAGNGHDVVLANAANDFTGAVSASGANVTLVDANALSTHLAASGNASVHATGALAVDGTVGGTLDAAGAGITQSTSLAVAGASTLAAGTHDVKLDAAGNDFGGLVTVNGANVSIADATALNVNLASATTATLASGGVLGVSGTDTGVLTASANGIAFGATTVGGSLNVSSTGNVTQSGDLHVTGASDLDSGAASMTLKNAGNSFGGGVTVAGANVDVEQAAALTAHLGGAVNATVASTAGAITVDGTATGNVTARGASVVLAATTVGGNLAATAGAGTVSQTGKLAVTGNSAFDAGTHDVLVTRTDNTFGGAVTANGAAVSLADAGALTAHVTSTGATTLAASGALTVDGHAGTGLTATGNSVTFGAGTTEVDGNLVVTTTGAPLAAAQSAGGAKPQAAGAGGIAQTGSLAVHGDTTLNAGAGDIVLDSTANALGTNVSATGHDVTITNSTGMTATVAATGDAALTATQGDLVVGGTFHGALAATGGSVEIGKDSTQTAVQSVGGPLAATATAGDVTLGYVSASGGVDVTASGDVLLQGTLGATSTVNITGATIRGVDGHGALETTSGVQTTLTAKSGSIGVSPGASPTALDPQGAITLLGLTGQGDGGGVHVQFPAGSSAWFSVTSRDQFQNLKIDAGGNGALATSAFACDQFSCYNILGQTVSLADSAIANILNAAAQDAADAAFGTENLDFAIRKGYVTTIGRVPPGIDEIAGDLGAAQCDSRVTSSTAIAADKACPVKAK